MNTLKKEAIKYGYPLEKWMALSEKERADIKNVFQYLKIREKLEHDFWKEHGEYNVSEMVEMAKDNHGLSHIDKNVIEEVAQNYIEYKEKIMKKGGKIKQGKPQYKRDDYGSQDTKRLAKPVGFRYKKIRDKNGRLRAVTKDDKQYYQTPPKKLMDAYKDKENELYREARKMIYFEDRADHSDKKPNNMRAYKGGGDMYSGTPITYDLSKVPNEIWEAVYSINSRFGDEIVEVVRQSDGAYLMSTNDGITHVFEKDNGLEAVVWDYLDKDARSYTKDGKFSNELAKGGSLVDGTPLYTSEELLKKFKNRYIDTYPHHYEYRNPKTHQYETVYEVRGVSKTIKENFQTPDEIVNDRNYKRGGGIKKDEWFEFWRESKRANGKGLDAYEKKYTSFKFQAPHVQESLKKSKTFDEFYKNIKSFKSGGEVDDSTDRIENILKHYIHAALWSSQDDEENNLDEKYDIEDIGEPTLKNMILDIYKFIHENDEAIKASGMNDEQLGHDLWLTRNGHGAGFWDRGYDKEVSDKLTNAADKMGSVDLYIGDDNKIHSSNLYKHGGGINEGNVKCNNCDWTGSEEELVMLHNKLDVDSADEYEFYKGCPNCKTDDFLMDFKKGGNVKWIQNALSGGKNKGSLRRTAMRKGLLRNKDEKLSMTDLKKLEKMGGKTARRARFAKTLRSFDKGGSASTDESYFIQYTTKLGRRSVKPLNSRKEAISFGIEKSKEVSVSDVVLLVLKGEKMFKDGRFVSGAYVHQQHILSKGGEIKEGDVFHIDTYRVSQYKGERIVDDVTIAEEPSEKDKQVLVYSPKLQANILVYKSDLKTKGEMRSGGEIKEGDKIKVLKGIYGDYNHPRYKNKEFDVINVREGKYIDVRNDKGTTETFSINNVEKLYSNGGEINGKQYSSYSSAQRAIDNYEKKHGKKRFSINQLDEGVFEVQLHENKKNIQDEPQKMYETIDIFSEEESQIVEDAIESGVLDTDDIKLGFNSWVEENHSDWMRNNDVQIEDVWSFSDEYFQNTLTYKENFENMKSYLKKYDKGGSVEYYGADSIKYKKDKIINGVPYTIQGIYDYESKAKQQELVEWGSYKRKGKTTILKENNEYVLYVNMTDNYKQGGGVGDKYVFEVLPVMEYNRTASERMKFYKEGDEGGEERKRGYVLKWKHEQGGSGSRFFLTMEELEKEKEKMTTRRYDKGGLIGERVKIELNDGKVIVGKLEKENPIKVRTDATSTRVIPNALIKSVTKYGEHNIQDVDGEISDEVYFNGSRYYGKAAFINGFNGYTSTEDDGVLCALTQEEGYDREKLSAWGEDGKPNYITNKDGFLIRSKNRRGQSITFEKDGVRYFSKGGGVSETLMVNMPSGENMLFTYSNGNIVKSKKVADKDSKGAKGYYSLSNTQQNEIDYFVNPTAIKKHVKGGGVGETFYIEYLNKKKGFLKDKKIFTGKDAYNDAIKWGRKNLDNFNIDMIRYQHNNGGDLKVTVKSIPQTEIDKFVDYVNDFYGKKGIYADELNGGFNKSEIEGAVNNYIIDLFRHKNTLRTWGGGDSLDRERVREYLDAKDFKSGGRMGFSEERISLYDNISASLKRGDEVSSELVETYLGRKPEHELNLGGLKIRKCFLKPSYKSVE